MASSNRHWPSMFKSKPAANSAQQLQCQQDLSSGQRSTSISVFDERSPEPKPRWNPRLEQIRILESIFNSGMVNPPREEIRKVRIQLQEYGQVGDANIFYWFQNRKSRSKHKHRQPRSHTQQQTRSPPALTARILTAPASSSSSSDKSSPSNTNTMHLSPGSSVILNSPTDSVNQFPGELFFSPVPENSGELIGAALTQGFCLPEVHEQSTWNYSGADLIVMDDQRNQKMKWNYGQDYELGNSVPIGTSSTSDYILQGLQDSVPAKSTVFINDVCFEIAREAFNVRESFGDGVVLAESDGQPVLTNEYGVTLQPLEPGSSYYLLRVCLPWPSLDDEINRTNIAWI